MLNRLIGRGILGTTFGASQGVERLEDRQLLSTAPTLPDSAQWVDWNGAHVAALRNSYIISFDGQQSAEDAVATARDLTLRLGVQATNIRSIARGQYATFETSDPVSAAMAKRLADSLPFVKSIEPNQVYQTNRVPNDPQFQQQYEMQNTGQPISFLGPGTSGADIHVTQAWDISIGTRNNIVAVIDTGIDLTHPDLIQNLWTNPGEIDGNGIDDDGNGFIDDVHGYDFGDNDANPQDDSATFHHGTTVAGVIGATGNNGLGVTGVNWNVSLMGLKIADRFGRLSTAAIVAAHDYATMMIGRGTNIVASNNSYGGFNQAFYADAPQGFSAEKDAIARFIATGSTFVAAAGNAGFDNDNPNFTNFPSTYDVPGIIAVAATDNQDQLATFSSYGVQSVDLGAPGVQVRTTEEGGGYTYIDGTSFSSPTVAGAVALLKSVKPNATAVEIREALINGCDPVPSLQGKVRSGGRLNVFRSMQLIQIDGPVVRTINPGPITQQFNPGTTTPLSTVTVDFSKDIDPAQLSNSAVTLRTTGIDGLFGTNDDILVPISSVTRSATDPRRVVISLDLSGFNPARLPLGNYQLSLAPSGFKDTTGNFLNGNSTGGATHTYAFRVAAATGDNEPNDTLIEATRLNFDASSTARLTGVTLGNGIFGPLDVDFYRLDLPRGGQITAEITAQRLPAGSSLDSVLRIFDASGVELGINDQFFGSDSYIDTFVQTSGTYYIAVSGFGNSRYDVNNGGSGTTQSLGIYNLTVGVRVSNDDVVTTAGFNPPSPLPTGTDVFTNYNGPAGPTTLIPPNAPTQTRGVTTAFIDITDSREILDMNVRIRLNHTFDSDLIISLISPATAEFPAGREVILSNHRGGSGQNFTNTIFDDEATASIATGAASFTGSFRPEQALGLFDGIRSAGRWTLKIDDTTTLNTGQLLNWALDITYQNNIFGPFESNDTLVTAKALTEIANGSGAASRTAFLGDGGFGNLDRDIFSFVAQTGASLSATVTPTGVFNSVIRLFDSLGNQILIANPSDRNTAAIDSYVFNNGGTYYLAVSETSNIAYDPTVIGTGTASASTGNYTLTVDIAAGVSDPGQVLAGSRLAAGFNTLAGFRGTSGSSDIGLRFDGVEFLPNFQSFFGAVGGGLGFNNGGTNTTTLPFALTNQSDPSNFRVDAVAQQRNGLRIERSISFAKTDTFFAIDVVISNAGTTSLSNVAYMEGFNPNPGVSLGDGSTLTLNDVANGQPFAVSRYVNNQFGQGLTVAMGAPTSDSRARATFVGSTTNPRDPGLVIAQSQFDPNGASADLQMVLTFDVGSLAAGASTTLRYFVFFGTTPGDVGSQYAAVNNGTGTGHLTSDPAAPSTEQLSDGSTVPILPYKVYFPEGATGDNIYTFVPISNPNTQTARVVAIARYEVGGRDQVIGELTIPGNSRSGFTLIDPASKANNTALVRLPTTNNPFVQYSVELRSSLPVAATFSHYDLNLVSGPNNFKAAVGEAFTSITSGSWSFANVERGGGNTNFIVWYNTTAADTKVDLAFYPLGGGQAYQTTFTLGAFRRGGVSINDAIVQRLGQNNDPFINLPDGVYGVTAISPVQIVASLSHFNGGQGVAEGSIGATSTGALSGVIAEGQIGLNGTSEQIAFLNTGSAASTVTISFLFQGGSAYRAVRTIAAASTDVVDVGSLPNFVGGEPYAIFYESTQPVIASSRSNAFSGQLASSTADAGYSWWGFGEGFRPGDNDPNHPGVVEHLRLYNPSSAPTTVEITISYDGTAGTEVFRRTLSARTVSEYNIHDFVTGARRLTNQWYSITVKAPTPIVAFMAHYDRAFQGAFGTLGTPLGRSASVS